MDYSKYLFGTFVDEGYTQVAIVHEDFYEACECLDDRTPDIPVMRENGMYETMDSVFDTGGRDEVETTNLLLTLGFKYDENFHNWVQEVFCE